MQPLKRHLEPRGCKISRYGSTARQQAACRPHSKRPSVARHVPLVAEAGFVVFRASITLLMFVVREAAGAADLAGVRMNHGFGRGKNRGQLDCGIACMLAVPLWRLVQPLSHYRQPRPLGSAEELRLGLGRQGPGQRLPPSAVERWSWFR